MFGILASTRMAAPISRPKLWEIRDVKMHISETIRKRQTSNGCAVMKYTIVMYIILNTTWKGMSAEVFAK